MPRPSLRDVTEAEVDAAIDATLASTDVPDTTALHDLFNQQIRDVLETSGLSEEDKQSVLVAMSCPCCGGGAGSFTYKLKPKD